MTTTIIRGGRVLRAREHRLEALDILIEGDTIRAMGPPGLAVPEGAVAVDATDRMLIPGFVNAHTHAHGGLSKGLVADRAALEVFLASAGAVNGARTEEDKYLAALLSGIEMIRKGSTACHDMFVEFPAPTCEGVQAAARAYRDLGMRAVIAPMMADLTLWQALPGLLDSMPEPERSRAAALRASPWEACAAVCRDLLARWPFDRDQVRPALGPTIPLHCSDAFLGACRDLAREFDVGVQIHLGETRTQAVLGRRKYGGQTLTAHLAGLGLLGPRFSGAHGVWLDADDMRRLADAGASVAHNPLSNLRLGSGIAAVGQMRAAGLTVGIGTDSVSTSDTQNMFEAARLASYLSRVVSMDPAEWLAAEDVLEMATEGSARVLGLGGMVGRIAPGFKADLLFVDLGHVGYVPLHDPAVQLVNGESGLALDRVMIGGRMVLEGGRVLTVDERRVRAEAERAVERLAAANADRLREARALEPFVGAFCLARTRDPYPITRLALQ